MGIRKNIIGLCLLLIVGLTPAVFVFAAPQNSTSTDTTQTLQELVMQLQEQVKTSTALDVDPVLLHKSGCCLQL